MNKDIYYRIARDLFLNSFASYDINEVGIHNPILHTCELYNKIIITRMTTLQKFKERGKKLKHIWDLKG